MALTLTLYSFSKRRNSTKQPTGGTNFDVVLKQPTSMNHPVFQLEVDDPTGFNYAKFNGRYYWIDDIISDRNNVWSIQCSIDPLATCKASILAMQAYVEYAKDGNSDIVDNRLAAEYSPIVRSNTQSFSMLSQWGQFYVATVGLGTTGTYGVTYSGMFTLLDDVANWAQNTIDGTTVESALTSYFEQSVGSESAADCVKAAYWLPIDPGDSLETPGGKIYLGQFETSSVGRIVKHSRQNVSETIGVIIPHNFMDWRRQEPYSTYYLYLPMYGVIEIPAIIAARNDSLSVTLTVNQYSGDYTYKIKGATDPTTAEIVVGGCCYSPVLIGSSNIGGGIFNATGQAAAGLMGTAGSAVAGFLGAFDTIGNFKSLPISAGATGGSSNLGSDLTCFSMCYPTSEDPGDSAATHGIPLCKTVTMSTLSGYVKCRDFSLQASEDSDIIDSVNELMNTGAFIE